MARKKKPDGHKLLDAFLEDLGGARAWAKKYGISESHLSRLRSGQRNPSTLMRMHLAKATRSKVPADTWSA